MIHHIVSSILNLTVICVEKKSLYSPFLYETNVLNEKVTIACLSCCFFNVNWVYKLISSVYFFLHIFYSNFSPYS